MRLRYHSGFSCPARSRMALPYELLIGLRYTRAKRRKPFHFLHLADPMLGIGLSVAALIVVLSVMNGFQKELRTRILGVASHIQITGINGELGDWPRSPSRRRKASGVARGAPLFSAGMFTVDGGVRARCAASCPTEEERVADFRKTIKSGSPTTCAPANSASCSAPTWRGRCAVHRRQGDADRAAGHGDAGRRVPRLKSFRVVGIFEVGMYEYDSGLALDPHGRRPEALPDGRPGLGVRPRSTICSRHRASGASWPG